MPTSYQLIADSMAIDNIKDEELRELASDCYDTLQDMYQFFYVRLMVGMMISIFTAVIFTEKSGNAALGVLAGIVAWAIADFAVMRPLNLRYRDRKVNLLRRKAVINPRVIEAMQYIAESRMSISFRASELVNRLSN
jgi:hypothetical protein